jgi:hypothetical protein
MTKNHSPCINQLSQVLSYSLGEDYLKTEKIICEKLNEEDKRPCYEGLGKRIGEIHFLNTSEGIGDCKRLNQRYFPICKESVCMVQKIYRSYLNETYCN